MMSSQRIDCLEDRGISMSDKRIINFQDDLIGRPKEKILKDVDGIFAVNDMLAIHAMDMISSLGIKIPEEIKVVGFDDIPIAKYCCPSLTSVRQDTERLAHVAVDQILDLIEKGGQKKDKEIRLPVSLVKRESTGQLK